MLKVIVIFSACALCVLAQGTPQIDPQPITVDPSSSTSTSTTLKPPTTITTPKPSTTPTNPPTTPTKPPTTSTKPPTTSTKPPTTSTKPPTTSTKSPTTSTKPPTTSTKPPTPDKLVVNNYEGNYTGQNNYCLRLTAAIQVELLEKGHKSTFVNVTKGAKGEVTCPENSTAQSLKINWDNNTIIFEFSKNGSKYEIESITVNITGNNETLHLVHKKPEFSTSQKNSYFCVNEKPLNLTDGNSSETLAKIHLTQFQYQAFFNSTHDYYFTVWNCEGVSLPDVVPIVVGCVLAVLVILVLGVYLYGRRRRQARGYLSM